MYNFMFFPFPNASIKIIALILKQSIFHMVCIVYSGMAIKVHAYSSGGMIRDRDQAVVGGGAAGSRGQRTRM